MLAGRGGVEHDVLVHFIVGPWPWSLLNVVSGVVSITAIFVAWKSADRVVPGNRPWTRAWRILVCGMAVAVDGIWLPLGAAYVVIRYGPRVARRVRHTSVPARA